MYGLHPRNAQEHSRRLDIHLKYVWFTPNTSAVCSGDSLDIHLKCVWFTPLGLEVGEFQPYTEK